MRTGDGYIINKCLNGNPSAFGFLVDKYKPSVYAFVYAELGNFHDAEDVTQEVFIRAYQKLRTLRLYDRFHAWLYSIASNMCKKWIQEQSKRPDRDFIEDQAPDTLQEPSIDPRRVDPVLETLHEALQSLPKTYRQVLCLYYLGGMNSKEIARFLGSSSTAIRQRLVRARARLKKSMLALMGPAFEQQRLSASFTFRVVEIVKEMRIQPLPRATGLPWGISITAGIFAVVLGFSTSPVSLNPVTDPAADSARMVSTDEISVDILDSDEFLATISRQTNDDSIFGLSATDVASIKDAERTWNSIGVGPTEWERYSRGPVLDVGPPGAWDDEEVFDCAVLFDGAMHKMWYSGYNGQRQSIGYATSADGIGWKKHPGNPVLDVGTSSEWDSYNVHAPAVLFDGAMYRMWYSGKDDLHWRIGYATSVDGIVWEKHPDNPVLDLGPSGTWEDWTVGSPWILFDGAQYKMWYQAYDAAGVRRTGYATSVDGIVWEKYPGNPVLDVGPPGAWDSHQAGRAIVVLDGTVYRMWYSGSKVSPDDTTVGRIGYAVSDDGIVWEKYPGNPVFSMGPGGTWDERDVAVSTVLFDGTTYKMWYMGRDLSMTKRIGYATSFSGTSRRACQSPR